MTSSSDQTGLMKEILDSLKNLELSQVQLASNVDAISGRVNVLAGMKEVRDVASTATPTTPVKKTQFNSSIDESLAHEDEVPESPSLPASQLAGAVPTSSTLSPSRKTGATSRIILT